MHEWGLPLLRPVVVSSMTGIPLNDRPLRPPETAMRIRWVRFINLKATSEGTFK